MRRSLLIAALAALVLVPAAASHGGGSRFYTSTPMRVEPQLPRLFVNVLDSDDRLWFDNETGKTVIVVGYQGEPYLRFENDGVYVNQRSPAKYLNEDRYRAAKLPAEADPKAAPSWKKLTDSRSYNWHDHRIHWMSTIPPKTVRDSPGTRHHVFDWAIPLRVGGKGYRLLGTLDYIPPAGSSGKSPFPIAVLAGGLGGAVALSAVLAFFLIRRGRKS